MEQLANKQLETGEKIEELIKSIKDDRPAKQSKKYFEEKLRKLNQLWNTFEEGDEKLREEYPAAVNHAYYRNSYDNQVRGLYEKQKADIQRKIAALRGDQVSPPSAEGEQSGDTMVQENIHSNREQIEGDAKYQIEETRGLTIQESSFIEIAPSTSILTTTIIRKSKGTMQDLERLINRVADAARPLTKAFSEVHGQNITNLWNELREYLHQLYEFTDKPENIGFDLDHYLVLENRMYDVIHELTEAKIDASCGMNPSHGSNSAQNMMKLPKVTLPKFEGNYLKWTQFHDLYTQMIHHQNIGPCQKMWYLKTHLAGEAERLIRHLPLSDENYTSAWKLLVERYSNKRLLVSALLHQLLSQPSFTTESASGLKNLHDTTQECILGLQNIEVDTASWDPILLHLLIKKLDRTTHTLYEQSLTHPKELQTIEGFLSFLEMRFQSLEALGNKGKHCEDGDRFRLKQSAYTVVTSESRCILCNQHHQLFSCKKFLDASQGQRYQMLKEKRICFNCLKSGHAAATCSTGGCKKCARKHNTLLHTETTQQQTPRSKQDQDKNTRPAIPSTSTPTSLAVQAKGNNPAYVLLGTVVINVTNAKGEDVECRAILDSGSQINLATESLVKRLGLRSKATSLSILGIGRGKEISRHRMNLEISSRTSDFNTRVEVFILPTVTVDQPAYCLDTSKWNIPKNIRLSDPRFHQPGKIDLLLGAELFLQLLSIGQIKLGKELPTLQNTVLGWIVSGRISTTAKFTPQCGVCSYEDNNLEAQVERFWKLEDVETVATTLTKAEEECESFFNKTTKQDAQGRYIVKLPFRQEPLTLGESKDIAVRRLHAVERRLAKDPELKRQYHAFMEEYIELGHMELAKDLDLSKPHYFLPHHGVIKSESTTTKLRVVFDASMKTSTNVSLNDILHTGPSIQDDLFTILLRFRLPRYVFTADIEKMYRQVWVAKEDRKYQLILWRASPHEPMKCYQLCTVTYGITSAPYLAIKALRKAAESMRMANNAEDIIKKNMYVDDLMCGADTLREASDLQERIRDTLIKTGFHLRKWCANHDTILKTINMEDRALQCKIQQGKDHHVKTLGMSWLPAVDRFSIQHRAMQEPRRITKRTVLSEIAHLFDPLGIISPVVIKAKIMLQELWQLNLEWDAAVPMEFETQWRQFRTSLEELNSVTVPRHVQSCAKPEAKQIHVFADASEKAYGAAVYIRVVRPDGGVSVRLLCAKSKVAPVKVVTIPRLELCAAKLASQLLQRVKKDLQWESTTYFMWTDSEIVLAWLNSASNRYHTFVANRIVAIQEVTPAHNWNHVPSKDNPADLISRGISVNQLKKYSQWFYGPLFLYGPEGTWPRKEIPNDSEVERRICKVALPGIIGTSRLTAIVNHRNSYDHLQRVVAYVQRFIYNSRQPNPNQRKTSHLSVEELKAAQMVIVKEIQQEQFSEDAQILRRTQTVNRNSPLKSLAPFLDEKGIIRVGGRLEAASLSYDAKHPMLLPADHPITRLIMTREHKIHLHAAPQALLAMTRQKFWPIKGKALARLIVQQCVTCVKAKPQWSTQLMGNLPATRIEPARPFVNAGVDFCGPMWIHYKLRGKRPQKCYVAIFCCFATKAVHIEVVSDLTADAFIAALKRFMSRRGNCKKLYCDNATNFVGACNKMKELQEIIHTPEAANRIAGECSSRGTQFEFIPPRAPHFGGLWEAAVKSAKYLMQRSIANVSVTYEELETLMVEIEGILNSRPLVPMSSDPNDFAALTPGHFLIGEPLTAMVDPHSQPCRGNVLQRWKMISQIKGEFWKRWTREYLCELQNRSKWIKRCDNIEPGTMVLVKEEDAPVLKWQIGRIEECIKGSDGLVRVVEVRTKAGVMKRPIHKIAILPVHKTQQDEQEDISVTMNQKDDTNQRSLNQQRPQRKRAVPNPISAATTSGPSARKQARKPWGLTAMLVVMCLIAPALANKVEIHPFQGTPMIYFESFGPAQIFSTEWNLVMFYDMDPYWEELDAMTAEVTQLRQICSLMRVKSSCGHTLAQFSSSIMEIQADNEFLSPERGYRHRRSPLNIVGNVANALFGVLDSEYAEHMSQIIGDVEVNEQHLMQLLKNQTSILDATVNLFEKSQRINREQHQAFQKFINSSIKEIDGVKEELKEARLWELFNSGASRLTLLLVRHHQIQNELIDVLTDCHHGRINPQLLSTKQLGQQIDIIMDQLPSSIQLPAQHKISEMYHLMSIQGHIAKSQLIFRIRIPLVLTEMFELLRIITLPIQRNHTIFSITPATNFILSNLHRDQYYTLTADELGSCISTRSTEFICRQHHPLYRRGTDKGSCEMGFLVNSVNLTTCRFRRIDQIQRWIQLRTVNSWIYNTLGNVTLQVVCGRQISQTFISGSGIIRIGNGCIIKDEESTITGHNLYTSQITTAYVPRWNPPDQVNVSLPKNTSLPSVLLPAEELDVSDIKQQLQALKKSERLQPLQQHDIHQFILGYSTLGIIFAIIAVFACHRWRLHRHDESSRQQRPSKDFRIRSSYEVDQEAQRGENVQS